MEPAPPQPPPHWKRVQSHIGLAASARHSPFPAHAGAEQALLLRAHKPGQTGHWTHAQVRAGTPLQHDTAWHRAHLQQAQNLASPTSHKPAFCVSGGSVTAAWPAAWPATGNATTSNTIAAAITANRPALALYRRNALPERCTLPQRSFGACTPSTLARPTMAPTPHERAEEAMRTRSRWVTRSSPHREVPAHPSVGHRERKARLQRIPAASLAARWPHCARLRGHARPRRPCSFGAEPPQKRTQQPIPGCCAAVRCALLSTRRKRAVGPGGTRFGPAHQAIKGGSAVKCGRSMWGRSKGWRSGCWRARQPCAGAATQLSVGCAVLRGAGA